MAPRGNKRKSRESNSSATQKFSTFYSKNSNNNDLLEGASSVFSIASWKWNSPRFLLGGTLLLILATFIEVPSPSSLFGSTITSSSSVSKNSQGIVGDALPHVTKDGKYHGAYPNSLLTLFYPFTLLRDVVLDQPVNRTDIPFFWHVHVSDEVAVKKALRKCYGADLIELDTVADISKAKNLNLISTLSNEGRLGSRTSEGGNQLYYNEQIGRPLVITSPHIREVSDLFSQDYYGRVFSFYRHPIDYNVHPELKKKLPPEAGTNNFLVRFLSNVHLDELGYKELGIAKQVIRQVTVSGTRDNMAESLLRMGQYFGWVPLGGLGTEESQESDAEIAQSCIQDTIQISPEERYADHNSPEWQVFYHRNQLDCQLYEVARSTWRAQIQTVIPLTLQVDRKCKVQAEKKEKDRDPLFKEMCQGYFNDEREVI